MPRLAIACLLTFLLVAAPALAQSDLAAIDVLLEPDETMLAAARDWNARLREQTPEGFELDAAHTPHITLLQTYVAADELDSVLAAVGEVAARLDLAALEMEATGLYHIPTGEIGVQGIVIAPSPGLLAVQASVIAAVAPFRRGGGGVDAFVPDPTGTPFDPLLFEYVETFVPNRSGANYNPHVSTGVGPLDWLEAREAEPFEHFRFGAKVVAVYRLGNFGTAAERLAAF
jgi:hypothetical protein